MRAVSTSRPGERRDPYAVSLLSGGAADAFRDNPGKGLWILAFAGTTYDQNFEFAGLVLSQPTDQMLGDLRHLPRPMRHEKDDDEQDDAEHRAGKSLRDPLGDVGHEDDEGRADQRSRQPSDAADHHAQEQRDRELDGVAVGGDEL